MLKNQFRLKRKKDFEILFQKGRFVDAKLVGLKIWRIDPAAFPRRAFSSDDLLIGFVVGTKIDKRAVVRNKMKRRLREAVRHILETNGIRKGYIMAFLAKPAMKEADYAEIQKNVFFLLNKAKILERL
ncbi:MAG TPA: ribonuclease P protein component [Candidatus Magasanikbacteria bacterium]|nr:MAG: ribonuclease P protein component [Candidatus Magasanikbacteria bacterium RIFCSPLOWO2_02_FULL_47_16]OGH79631.1 MAG: ribonuclease P protein component [Candidatus Magasanikbacteria bacterium RIFCSPHIGHO2_02_FULL_48_18]OGH82349.1 MAG: ribonuclease P protein component [Candidatus Magasanikbacteria bacterium RIFCSPLOWO2_12_FULL_47_9b]HAZ28317.1 ribonuclease P protein component [Candidatus Magasanikbacteria bacterium]